MRERGKLREPWVGETWEKAFCCENNNQAAPFRFHGEITIYITFKLTLVHSPLGHIFSELSMKEI
jgi:hypothetical protein